jgi:putative ABC transport system permease protein
MTFSKIQRSCLLAIRSLWLHKLRAFLSVLGIIIGTSAVIAMMAFGKGSMQDALDDIKRQGATNIIVRSVKPTDESNTGRRTSVAEYGLTRVDFERLATIEYVSRMVPMRVFPQEIRRLERMQPGRVVATMPEYQEINQINIARGRFINHKDDDEMNNVVVLGSNMADQLFPFEDPVGQTIVIASNDYKVIGVMSNRMPTGGAGGSLAAEDYNNDVYMPIHTYRHMFGATVFLRQSGSRSGEKVEFTQITLTIDSDVDSAEGRMRVKSLGEYIRNLLKDTHRKIDWAVTVPLDRLEEAERAQDRFTSLLFMIASISLVVGGIGIMNIMLATVTERTREIGIRRALGAKRQDITLQFLVEAVVQTTVGGLIGVIVGLTAIFALPAIWEQIAKEKLPALVHETSIFLSLGMSVLVGVLAGWYPAQRAAGLDPIEALRHE